MTRSFAFVANANANANATRAINLSDGTPAWETPLTGELAVAAGRLFIATKDGLLVAYKLTQPD
jgi:hypothetical protein